MTGQARAVTLPRAVITAVNAAARELQMIKSSHPKLLSGSRSRLMNWQHFVDLLHGEMASGIVGSSLARLMLAAILGGLIGLEREFKHRARRAAHQHVHLFRRGACSPFCLASAGRRAFGLHPHRGADHSRHRFHRRRFHSAHARPDHRTHHGGHFVCRRLGRHGGRRRTLPDRDLCHRTGSARAVFPGPPGGDIQSEAAAVELRSHRHQRRRDQQRGQPHPRNVITA